MQALQACSTSRFCMKTLQAKPASWILPLKHRKITKYHHDSRYTWQNGDVACNRSSPCGVCGSPLRSTLLWYPELLPVLGRDEPTTLLLRPVELFAHGWQYNTRLYTSNSRFSCSAWSVLCIISKLFLNVPYLECSVNWSLLKFFVGLQPSSKNKALLGGFRIYWEVLESDFRIVHVRQTE